MLSIYFLIGNLVSLIPAFIEGLILDKVKNWKIVAVILAVFIGFVTLFVSQTPTEDHIYDKDGQHQSAGMTIGFIGMFSCAPCMFIATQSLLQKSIASNTTSRAVFLTVSAGLNAIGVCIIEGLGGNMSDNDKRSPFFLCLGMQGLTALLIFFLACCK